MNNSMLKYLLLYLFLNSCKAEDGCNEYVCGSVVSKCLLTQSCQCKLTDCYCCKDCFTCLGDLYAECCACLEMCPQRNDTLSILLPKSQIGDFEGVPELFESLTSMEDDEEWSVMRFPMRASINRRFHTGAMAGRHDAIDHLANMHKTQTPIQTTVNCTVIYLNVCTTFKKCAHDCESMGANSYRWFHDGCCQCVGAYCINYGINESRCSACPDDEEENEFAAAADYGDADADAAAVGDDDSLWDYGENDMNYN